MKHYVVLCEYCVDGESGVDVIGVRHTKEEAQALFKDQIPVTRKEAQSNYYDEIEEYEAGFVTFKSGNYCLDHIVLFIEKSDN